MRHTTSWNARRLLYHHAGRPSSRRAASTVVRSTPDEPVINKPPIRPAAPSFSASVAVRMACLAFCPVKAFSHHSRHCWLARPPIRPARHVSRPSLPVPDRRTSPFDHATLLAIDLVGPRPAHAPEQVNRPTSPIAAESATAIVPPICKFRQNRQPILRFRQNRQPILRFRQNRQPALEDTPRRPPCVGASGGRPSAASPPDARHQTPRNRGKNGNRI